MFSMLMCIILTSTSLASVFANSANILLDHREIAVEAFEELSNNYNVNVNLLDHEPIGRNSDTIPSEIHFESIEALEEFVAFLDEFNSNNDIVEIFLDDDGVPNSNAITRNQVQNLSSTYTWQDWAWFYYATLAWETLIWKNIRAEYTAQRNSLNQSEFVRAGSVSSWISGATMIRSWMQRGSTTNITRTSRARDTLAVVVDGTYTLGVSVSVGGVSFPVGITSNQTWRVNFRYY